jgi:hypothetical protein
VDELGGWGEVFFEGEETYGDGEFEAARAAGAGIEIEHTPAMSDVRLVRVAVENRRKPGRGGVEVQGLHIVQHVEVVALKQEDLCFGQTAAGPGAIDVAADGGDGRDGGERLEDFRIADIAKMKDAFDAVERRQDFRAKESVGIADDTQLHRPKLNRSDQRLLDSVVSGRWTGSIIWRG